MCVCVCVCVVVVVVVVVVLLFFGLFIVRGLKVYETPKQKQ